MSPGMRDPFEQRRQQVLADLDSTDPDKSRAGGVDARIQSFMSTMNTHADLYTTSSCSGRISVFAEPSAETRAAGLKGGEWVYATHDLADFQAVLASIQDRLSSGSQLIFRFEPFILAAECRDMSTAQQLVAVAREAGFRESGVTATKARTIAGIRCSLRLEVPVADKGQMLVSHEYLRTYLVDFGNEKMGASWDRTQRFAALFNQKMLPGPAQQGGSKHASGQGCTKPKAMQAKAQTVAKQQHISSAAAQQLIAHGVPQHILAQVQAALHTLPGNADQQHHSRQKQSGYIRKSKQQNKGRAATVNGNTAIQPDDACCQSRSQVAGQIACQSTNDCQPATAQADAQHASQFSDKHQSATAQDAEAGAQPSDQHQAATAQADAEAGCQPSGKHPAATTDAQADAEAGCQPSGKAPAATTDARADAQAGSQGNGPAATSSLALALKARQGAILQRITSLEEAAVQSSCASDLHWQPLAIELQDLSSSVLNRWGHTAIAAGDNIIIFGGYGGSGAHSRNADVLVYNCSSHQLVLQPIKGEKPSARMGHSAVLLGASLVIFGGRDSPARPLNDVWLLDTTTWQWQQVTCSGAGPCARFRHTAVGTGSSVQDGVMYVYGGFNGKDTFGDAWTLRSDDWSWHQLETAGPSPSPRHSHAATLLGHSLYVHGGSCTYQHTFAGLHALDLRTMTWQTLAPDDMSAAAPTAPAAPAGPAAAAPAAPAAPAARAPAASPACFSHSITAVGDVLVVAGGCHTQGAGQVHSYDLSSCTWAWHDVQNSSSLVLCRHTATAMGTCMYCFGGGMNCFGFGTTFSPASRLDLAMLVQQQRPTDASLVPFTNRGSPSKALSPLDGHDKNGRDSSNVDFIHHKVSHRGGNVSSRSRTNVSNSDKSASTCRLPSGDDPQHDGNALESSSSASAGGGRDPGMSKLLNGTARDQDLWQSSGAAVHEAEANGISTLGHEPGKHPGGGLRPAFAVEKAQAKAAKDSLRALDWLDRAYKAQTNSCGRICLPLTDQGQLHLTRIQTDIASALRQSHAQKVSVNGRQPTHAQTDIAPQEPAPLQTEADAVASHADPFFYMPPSLNGHTPVVNLAASPQLETDVLSATHSAQLSSRADLQPINGCPSVLHSTSKGSKTATIMDLQGHANASSGTNLGKEQCQEQQWVCLRDQLASCVATVQLLSSVASGKTGLRPAARLRHDIAALLHEQALPTHQQQALLAELPVKWEKLGNLALLPHTCMTSPEWQQLIPGVWQLVAGALGVHRLARQAPVANTGTRDSQAEMLLGGDGWVQHKEGGVLYCLDVTKCMFSSGNTTVRQRMGQLPCSGETIVDLFAGIGYYTLPFLCKSGAAKVYACEWNPNAIAALRKNLELNDVADKCKVLPGDCTLTAPKGVADRVSLGLLPSSEGAWGTALAALKPQGGCLHLHNNVTDTEELEWCQATLAELQRLAEQQGRLWHFRLTKVERVKWYAPHIRHVVLDIEVSPKINATSCAEALQQA